MGPSCTLFGLFLRKTRPVGARKKKTKISFFFLSAKLTYLNGVSSVSILRETWETPPKQMFNLLWGVVGHDEWHKIGPGHTVMDVRTRYALHRACGAGFVDVTQPIFDVLCLQRPNHHDEQVKTKQGATTAQEFTLLDPASKGVHHVEPRGGFATFLVGVPNYTAGPETFIP